MKYIILLLAFAAVTWGFVDEDGWDSSIPSGSMPQGTDVISLSYVNAFQVPAALQILGLDHQNSISYLGLMDNESDSIRGVVDDTGSQIWTLDTPCANIFGLAHNWPVSYDWYVNSWTDTNIYLSGPWAVSFPNPAGTLGRGMDYNNDTDMLWETYSSSGVWRIDVSGSGTFYSTPEVPGQISGLAVFPFHGNLGVALCFYSTPGWLFYEFDGSNLTYYGSADLGLGSFDGSRGLTYNAGSDTFFYSYIVYGTLRWIMEVSWMETSLEQNTWGAIKTSF